MKKIDAIIHPYKLPEVKEALAEIGITTLTVSEAQEADRSGRHVETYRGQRDPSRDRLLPLVRREGLRQRPAQLPLAGRRRYDTPVLKACGLRRSRG